MKNDFSNLLQDYKERDEMPDFQIKDNSLNFNASFEPKPEIRK
jgi:hypothetical protein